MKKVNFNALQNFEVPESWIEKAINAKPAAPKKKPIYLNSRYLSTAASVVLAVGITVFSPLFLNRGITLPVKDVFATSSAASAPQQDTTPGTTQASGITPTLPPAATKGTEASIPSATGNTQNEQTSTERPGSQTGNPSTQPTVNSEQTNTPSGQTEQPVQPVQPKTTEPHHIIQPQTMPQKPTTPEQETKTTEPVQDSTGATEPMQKITTNWMRVVKISPNSFINDNNTDDDTFSVIPLCELFEKNIKITIPQELWDNNPNLGYIKCSFSNDSLGIKDGKDGNAVVFDFDNVKPLEIKLNLSDWNINIPCEQYKMSFMFYSTEVQELTINSIATEYSVELKDDITIELQ